MGQILDFNTPSVNPTGAPPNDYLRVQPNMGLLAEKGQALQKFGGSVEKAGGDLTQIAEFQGRINVDDQVNKFLDQRNRSLYGDPNNPNDRGFLGLEGRSASDARAGTLQQLEESRQAGKNNLKSPMEQLAYETQTRRLYQEAETHIGSHTQQQWKVWGAGVNAAGAGHELNEFVNNLDDPQVAVGHVHNYINFKVQEAQLKYGDDPQIRQAAEEQAKLELLEAHVNAVAVRDPERAIEILDSNKKTAGTQYDNMYNRLRDRADAQVGQKYGQEVWGRSGRGLSDRAGGVRDDAAAALQQQGVPFRVTSEYRSPEHNAAVGGARGSQHLHGNAIDVSLTGLTPDQQQAVVTQFLSDPRVGGFGFYPRSNSIHVDVRQGGRAAWGTDYHGDSVGQGWPSWLTQQVQAWQGGAGANAAPAALHPPASPAGALPLRPASFEVPTPAGTEPAALPSLPRAALPAAVAPTWEEKKATALRQLVDDPALRDRPKAFAAAWQEIEKRAQIEHATAIDDTAAQKAQEKAARMASDAAEMEVMQDAYSTHPKISATQMLARPDLTREAKERLLKFYPVNEDRESDLKKYGSGFFDAYKAVHAPAGDPARITNPDKLYDMAGPNGSLTVAGVDKLLTEMYKPKNPETEAETDMKKTFLDSARRQVSGEGLVPGMKDPKGEQIFLGFLGYFFPAYDKARKEGKTPAELLDPNSKDYLGKSLDTMKRPMSDWYSDVLKDNPSVAGAAKPAAPPFNPASVTSLDQLKGALAGGTIDRAQAIQIGLQHGWIKENPVKSLPAPAEQPHVPISQ